jgi:MSHA pilin protein MshC
MSQRHCPLNETGFTMVELIVVMIIVGIMAVTVLPRMSLLGGFESVGFRDQTVATLRYAQKTALAQRRIVCVAIANAGLTLTMDTDTPPNGGCEGSGSLTPPFTPRPGTGLSGQDSSAAALTSFNFNTIGGTNLTGTLTLRITDANDILVDADTGYVR